MSILSKVLDKYDVSLMLGVSRQAVNSWLDSVDIPPLRALQIEYITAGEFKALDLIEAKNLDKWDDRSRVVNYVLD